MKSRSVSHYKNIDEYIAHQEPGFQPMLLKMRTLIQSVVPDAEECISYMIPCYKQQGMLVGFGTHKTGCSFYTMNPNLLRSYANELKEFKYTGSTIHFNPKKPLPARLIKKLIRQRIKENVENAWLNKQSKLAKTKNTIK